MGRKRKTTQQFIGDARKIHGDRYDYSKVEYIDVNTGVCIICPEHGEFWDTPVRHLRGNICPECKFEVFGGKNKRKWTHETCYEEAKKYNNIKDFNKRSPSAYYRAKVEGWLDEYVWLVRFNVDSTKPKWTYESCYEEAKKYKIKHHFKLKSSGAYNKARAEGWLDEYTWLSTLKTKIKWSYERCYEEAKKYENRGDFFRGCKGAYDKARIEGWLDDYSWFSKEAQQKSRWTYKSCYEEAKKYENRSKFHDNNKGAYNAALRNGWLDDYSWFKPKPPQRPTGYWDVFENIKDESKKYKSRHAFHLGNYGAYKAARRNGWLDILFPLQK